MCERIHGIHIIVDVAIWNRSNSLHAERRIKCSCILYINLCVMRNHVRKSVPFTSDTNRFRRQFELNACGQLTLIEHVISNAPWNWIRFLLMIYSKHFHFYERKANTRVRTIFQSAYSNLGIETKTTTIRRNINSLRRAANKMKEYFRWHHENRPGTSTCNVQRCDAWTKQKKKKNMHALPERI